ncbi:aspartate--tRNA ligase msd1 [Dispira simplex]|nr:aspartate--tRNA ligase msd1 [Dispira simplex]
MATRSVFRTMACRQTRLRNSRGLQVPGQRPAVPFKPHPRTAQGRTHAIDELHTHHTGQTVTLCGWLQYVRRASPTLLFLGLRDRSGVIQVVYEISEQGGTNSIHPIEDPAELFQRLVRLSPESVLAVHGIIHTRPAPASRPLAKAMVEVHANEITILNEAQDLPFTPDDRAPLPKEEVRLSYRYLDLRRRYLQDNLCIRSKLCHAVRRYLVEEARFTEVETPILFKSTPEGAREFVVPTRIRDRFFALPQSPQQFKQLLMAGGVDRYFQIARCFRDEDLRADRQPEFTQIDLEMAFITSEDVIQLLEALMRRVWQTVRGVDILAAGPLPRMTYTEAISRYGSDKPDLRFDMPIQTLAGITPTNQPTSLVEYLVISHQQTLSRKDVDHLKQVITDSVGNNESEATSVYRLQDRSLRCLSSHSVLDYPNDDTRQILWQQITPSLNIGDLVVVSIRRRDTHPAFTTLGRVRLTAASLLEIKGQLHRDPDSTAFVWIHSFPLFTPELDAQGQLVRFAATHHPFTAPVDEDIEQLRTHPNQVRAQHYDLVLNGSEIAGGSIRIHSPALQSYIFEHILRLTPTERQRFHHLVTALGHGCPPHGGIAVGLDRLVAILCHASSIRDVIAFPKSSSGQDLLMQSPSSVTDDQLATYHVQLLPSFER